MGLDILFEEGQILLDEIEKEELRIKTIANRKELDELVQLNIEAAVEWTLRKKFSRDVIISEKFINDLHKRMFGKVWEWAGKLRKTNKNMGVDKLEIATSLRQLLYDCKYWMDNNSYSEDETAIRFKHRLVSIHCYSNGNGRHARLMADIIITQIFHKKVFSWGEKKLPGKGEARKNYLKALKAADSADFELLIEFARS